MVETPDAWKWSSYRATAGRESPRACLSTNWILGQFGSKRGKAEKEYKQFVQWGIGKTIWAEVRGQAILGEEEFGDKLVEHLKKHTDITEIPKSQRYVNRQKLDMIFTEKVIRDKQKRDKKIADAVEKHLYSQREIAAHLNLHYTSISRILSKLC